MTWQECIRTTVENNADLRASVANVRSNIAQEGVAQSGYYPQLNAVGTWIEATDSMNDVTASTQHTSDFFTSTLKFNENVFNGFQDIEKWRQAKANTASARAALLAVKAQVSYGLKQAYEGYMYAKAFQKLTTDIIQRLKENLRIVELRFQSGRENRGSVLLSPRKS